MLEYLKINPCGNLIFDAIATFLKLNPNVRNFTILSNFVWKNCHSMKNVNNIPVDEL